MMIRKAKRRDVPSLCRLTRELALYEKYPGEATITELATSKLFFGRQASAECYVIEERGAIVGMVKLLTLMETWTGVQFFLLRDFFIRDKYRGRGWGGQLLDEIIKLSRKRGYGSVQFNVFDWNKTAIRFYERAGASVVNTHRMRIGNEAFSKASQSSRKKAPGGGSDRNSFE